LLTRSISSLMEESAAIPIPTAPSRGPALRVRDSLIDALDRFKHAGCDELPVRRRGRTVGTLRKKSLLAEISRVLGELEATS